MTGRSGRLPSVWLRLDGADIDADRVGHKAQRLARAHRAGIAVLDGFVLPTDVPSEELLECARQLLVLDPRIDEWLLRSSSPLEDRPGASAAGLFASRAARSGDREIALALREVLESAHESAVASLLSADAPPVAVLAQPLVHFDAWATVESHGDNILLEGWRRSPEGHRESWVEELRAPEAPGELDAILAYVRTQHPSATLLEIGWRSGHPFLLQWRPAPDGPSTTTQARSIGTLPIDLSHAGWGLHVHPGDEKLQWKHDSEHSMLPLCPLLAGLFGRWIAAENHPASSRLLDGYWYDRIDERGPIATAPTDDDLLALRLRAHALEKGIGTLEAAAARVQARPHELEEFWSRWLDFQSLYFSASTRSLRLWAHAQDEGRSLDASLAAGRRRRWQRLADRLEESGGLPRSAAWLAADARDGLDEDLSRALEEERSKCEHLGAQLYDGRGSFWGEDPSGFFREIQRRRGQKAADLPTSAPTTPATEILCAGEDDNDALQRSYWLLRRVLRGLAPALHLRSAEDLLDLMPSELTAFLEHPDREALENARRKGRALYLQWRARSPVAMADHGSASGGVTGITASGGRAVGPLRIGRSLEEIAASEESPIAVVPLVTPLDAVHFDRIAGLVCEGGDRLGHASILAREFEVPCIVQVGRVSQRLIGAGRALLDADAGELRPLPTTARPTFTEDER